MKGEGRKVQFVPSWLLQFISKLRYLLMVLTLTGDVDAVVGGEEEVASDTPFETGSSFSSLS